MQKVKTLFLRLFFVWFATVGNGAQFAPVFNDGAVLQCDMPVNVWGTAEPGESVTVAFAGQEKTAVASESGKWQVVLDPMEASAESRKLTVSSSIENQKSEISNVVVGEVWLASGQSNMAFALAGSDGAATWMSKTFPDIRFIRVPQKTGIPIEKEYTADELAWESFAPSKNARMSAVCFHFSRKVQEAVGRPVGILQSAVAGTPCEAWTPEWALDAKPELKHLAGAIRKGVASGRSREECLAEVEADNQWFLAHREWRKTRKGPAPVKPPPVDPGNPWSQRTPTVLYENMIVPLLTYTARGVIWYQGEYNSDRPDEYRILFPEMIMAWRKAANRPDWPFLFVQLPAFSHATQDWPGLRAAQTFTRDTVSNASMAVMIDLGEKNDLHPRAKQPVGERLARLALDQVYGQKVVSRGPAFQTLEKKNGKLLVHFQCSEDGLKTSDGKAEVPGFAAAGSDGKFYPAQARIISKDTVELTSPEVQKPVSVRYAWYNWIEPPVTLQNSAGLPAEPFSAEIGEMRK